MARRQWRCVDNVILFPLVSVNLMHETLIFGGSFDPVHNGHIAMLDAAVAHVSPAATLVIPVGNAWQKARMPFAAARHRVAMLKLAMPQATVDERELTRGGPTYSVDTMRELKRDHPTTRFVWLLGGDAFSRIDSWEEPVKLASMVRFVVVRRAGDTIVPPKTPLTYDIIACDPPDVSSTMIRAKLAEGSVDHEVARNFVPAAVYDYIQQHKLYS